MSLLLCAATAFEIQPTLDFIKDRQLDHRISVVYTGVGLMASTYTLTRQAYVQRPQMIIQAGIAGTLDATLPLTKVVAVKAEIVGDLGVMEKDRFLDLFGLGFIDNDRSPFTNGQLLNPHLEALDLELRQVTGVTVNEITTNKDRILYYAQTLGVQTESMEGAALHFVALQEGIPFLQVRSISNYIGERNKQAWKLQESIGTLNSQLQTLLIKLLEL